MMGNDDARCNGVTSVRGIPLPCCVQCERRIFPNEGRVFVAEFKPQQVMREWRCDGQVLYVAF